MIAISNTKKKFLLLLLLLKVIVIIIVFIFQGVGILEISDIDQGGGIDFLDPIYFS